VNERRKDMQNRKYWESKTDGGKKEHVAPIDAVDIT
jgi:hypothetical protein